MKHVLLLLVVVFSGCATAVRIPPVDAYIVFDGPPTYYKADAASPATGLVFHRNDKVWVIKRQSPNWLVFSLQGKDIYIAASSLDTRPVETVRAPYDTSPLPSYSPSSGSHDIQTGPRGGHYYINSHGNKTYVRHK